MSISLKLRMTEEPFLEAVAGSEVTNLKSWEELE